MHAAGPSGDPPCPRFAGLAAEFLGGRQLDLLAPIRFLAPGVLPASSPARPDRRELAAALGAVNAGYGHPRAAERAARLADPATRVVVTGQQTGLFGGPLLALVKAAAVARWAAALEAADGQPTEAVFWMATEDHDFAEVASATVLGRSGPVELTLGEDRLPLVPVGTRRLGTEVQSLHERLTELATGEWSTAWLVRLADWWAPGAAFGEAFARTQIALLGDEAPLFLDSMLPELKRAEQPHLAALIERRAEWNAAVERREVELERRGFTPQVAPQPGASPLFLLRDGQRRRIEWPDKSHFALRGLPGSEPVAQLLAQLADDPTSVSPGALARPAIQDAVLGSSLVLLGPGELAYFAQASASYEILGLPAPAVALRPHALIVSARDRERLSKLGSSLGELLERPQQIERRLAERGGAGFVAPVRAAMQARIAELETPAVELDPTLARAFARTQGTVARALERFEARVRAAASRREGDGMARLRRLEALLRPGGVPQERRLAAAGFAARWGESFGRCLAAGLDLDPTRYSVIDPDAPRAGEGGRPVAATATSAGGA